MWLKRIKNPEKVKDIRVFQTPLLVRGSAICLPGFGIFLSQSIPENAQKAIIQHEYGHFLDYRDGLDGEKMRFLGSSFLGFYLKIGIPSLFNLVPVIKRLSWFKGDHRVFWTEIRANQLASRHFGNLLAEGFEKRFPTQVF